MDVLGTHSATTSLQIVIEEVQTFIFEQSDYYGQVLFSEIAWMGTSASPYDEWFELYIVTGSVYPLDGTIVAWGTYDTESGTFENEIILDLQEVFFQEDIFVDDDDDDVDDEYNDDDPFVSSLVTPQVFLFERTDDTTVILHNAFQIYTGGMNNNGEHLYLFDSEGKIIDEVDASDGWFAGDNVTKETMIRVHVGTDGNDESSWCSFSSCETEVDEVIVQNGVDAEGNVILGSVGYPLFVVIPMW